MGCGASKTPFQADSAPSGARKRDSETDSVAVKAVAVVKDDVSGVVVGAASSRGSQQLDQQPKDALVTPSTTPSTKPLLQARRTASAPLTCLSPQQVVLPSETLPPEVEAQKSRLEVGRPEAEQLEGVSYLRGLTCSTTPPSGQLLASSGAVALLVDLVRHSKASPVRVEALWALVNACAVGYEASAAAAAAHVGQALVAVMLDAMSDTNTLQLAFWAAANIAGSINPSSSKQDLVEGLLAAGLLKPTLAAVRIAGSPQPTTDVALLRCALWCLHNLTKAKREREVIDAIPLLSAVLLNATDIEVLTCAAWSLAFIAGNAENMEFLRQALDALPKLVLWVRQADNSLCSPALVCLGAMCTGYGAQDYSSRVVEAGGVPAMLAYLRKASSGSSAATSAATSTSAIANGNGNSSSVSSSSTGGGADVGMQREALFALSNVAGANSAAVQALLDAGAFEHVIGLLQGGAGGGHSGPGTSHPPLEPLDPRLVEECLYVLTNPLAHSVNTDCAVTKALVKAGVVSTLCSLLTHPPLPGGLPGNILLLVLAGLQDGIKKGQQLMKWAAEQAIFDGTPAPPHNPIVAMYKENGTYEKLQELNSTSTDESIRSKANGILNIISFM